MKYQYDISERKFTILFDKTQQSYIMSILELIECKFCKTRQFGYLILIDGLESTMDDFIESCSSKNFFIHDNGKHNFLSKKLPTLCMFTREWNDVIIFKEFIGSFNEGQMSLLYLSSNFNFDFFINEKKALLNINDFNFRIDVFSDGNEIEITAGINETNFDNEFKELKLQIQKWREQ